MPSFLPHYFELLEYMPIGICVIDRSYSILFFNKTLCQWMNSRHEEVAGQNLLELYPHLRQGKYKSRFDMSLKEGTSYVFSSQLHPQFFPSTLPNGQLRIQRTTLLSHAVSDDERMLIFCIHDVTDSVQQVQKITELQREGIAEIEARKKTLQELEEANRGLIEFNKEKDRIMQIITHDLRSPLSGIRGAAEFIYEDYADQATVLEFSEMIISTSDSLLVLINDFLDIAKVNAGRISLHLEQCDLREIVHTALQYLHVLISNKSLEIISTVPYEEVPVHVDRSKILQVLTNLLSNAIKFTPVGGRIAITVDQEDGKPKMYMSDTGIGIAPEDIPGLFEQFARNQRAGTTGEQGTGLGMSLIKSFVELHGGSITVESVVGQGTTFVLTLPGAPPSATVENSSINEE